MILDHPVGLGVALVLAHAHCGPCAPAWAHVAGKTDSDLCPCSRLAAHPVDLDISQPYRLASDISEAGRLSEPGTARGVDADKARRKGRFQIVEDELGDSQKRGVGRSASVSHDLGAPRGQQVRRPSDWLSRGQDAVTLSGGIGL